jgi:hypothetical protein
LGEDPRPVIDAGTLEAIDKLVDITSADLLQRPREQR